jgi:hypothetical protein
VAVPSFLAFTKQTDQVRLRDAPKCYPPVCLRPRPRSSYLIALRHFLFFYLFLSHREPKKTQNNPQNQFFNLCCPVPPSCWRACSFSRPVSLLPCGRWPGPLRHMGFFGTLCWNFRSYKRDCICVTNCNCTPTKPTKKSSSLFN